MSGPSVAKLRAEARADMALGVSASWEELVVAALVALPFAGCLGIFVNVATGAPPPAPLLATLLVEVPLTLWIAGRRRRHPEA